MNQTARKKGQRTLLALFAISIIPIAAAYFMFFTGIGVPEHTVNNGKLLKQPVKLSALLGPEHAVFLQRLETEKKWRLLLPISDTCNEDCEKVLYTTRQVHVRLAQKSVRVERVAVNIGGTVGLRIYEAMQAEHPKLQIITVDPQAWENWLAASGDNFDIDRQAYYLLVDQEGTAMMAYTADIHGNLLLKDLKRALKYSIDFQK